HSHTNTQTHTDTLTHTNTQTHTDTLTHTNTQTQTHTATQPQPHNTTTKTHTDTLTHTNTQTQTHTDTHTHTHTHTKREHRQEAEPRYLTNGLARVNVMVPRVFLGMGLGGYGLALLVNGFHKITRWVSLGSQPHRSDPHTLLGLPVPCLSKYPPV